MGDTSYYKTVYGLLYTLGGLLFIASIYCLFIDKIKFKNYLALASIIVLSIATNFAISYDTDNNNKQSTNVIIGVNVFIICAIMYLSFPSIF